MFTVMFRGMLRGFKHIKRISRNTDIGNAVGRSRHIPENTHARDCNVTPRRRNKRTVPPIQTPLLQHQTALASVCRLLYTFSFTLALLDLNLTISSFVGTAVAVATTPTVTPLFGSRELIRNTTFSRHLRGIFFFFKACCK